MFKNEFRCTENFSGKIVPIILKWKVNHKMYSGGYGIMIDFKAEPYGICTFYIGGTSVNDHGIVEFSNNRKCKKLIHDMGDIQSYWVKVFI